jgi:hypothetical protein
LFGWSSTSITAGLLFGTSKTVLGALMSNRFFKVEVLPISFDMELFRYLDWTQINSFSASLDYYIMNGQVEYALGVWSWIADCWFGSPRILLLVQWCLRS